MEIIIDHSLKPITSWHSWNNEFQVWDHNHIEDGHSEAPFPKKKLDEEGKPFPAQKSWGSGKWMKKFDYLDENNKVIS